MPLPPMGGIMGPFAPGFCMPKGGGGMPTKSQPVPMRSREASYLGNLLEAEEERHCQAAASCLERTGLLQRMMK